MKNLNKILYVIVFVCTNLFSANAQIIYNLTVNSYPQSGGGTSPSGTSQWSSSSTVTITAFASPGYIFTGWTGSATGAANPISIPMNSNKTLTANFVRFVNLDLSVFPLNSGFISGGGSGLYPQYTQVTVTAVPFQGYRFVRWTGDLDTTATLNPLPIRLINNKSIIANFESQ